MQMLYVRTEEGVFLLCLNGIFYSRYIRQHYTLVNWESLAVKTVMFLLEGVHLLVVVMVGVIIASTGQPLSV